MEELLKYFIKETDRKFDDIRSNMEGVNVKLEDLTKFKVEMLATARATSFMVSVVVGVISTAISVFISIRYAGH